MKLIFNKYHGAGNDFIMIDNRDKIIKSSNSGIVSFLCNRHMGIGADGLILINEDENADFSMQYFNSDGNEAGMCGNGGRCAAAFANKAGISGLKGVFKAADGNHSYSIKGNEVSISLNDTPAPSGVDGNHFLNTGSPHYIIYVPDINRVDVFEKGKKTRNSDSFSPGGTNVNFVQHTDGGIYVRTYERGVENETLSCGTGVTAAAISSKWDKGTGKYSVSVKTRGGLLYADFKIGKEKITGIHLRGPAEFVFAGVINI